MGLEDKPVDKVRPGQLRGGFNVIARDVDRALAIARFEPGQVLLIEQARELSWTSAKIAGSGSPKPFRINVSALSRIAGCERSWLNKQFNKLVECGVFVATESEAFLINKDFRSWLDDRGQTRLSEDQVGWCVSAQRRQASHAKVSRLLPNSEGSVASQGESSTTQSPGLPATQGQTFSESSTTQELGCLLPTPGLSTTQGNSAPLGTPLCDRGRVEFLESRDLNTPEGRGALDSTSCPPYPDSDGALDIMLGSHPIMDADARSIWALLWKSFQSQTLCNAFYEHQQFRRVDCWYAAIRDAVRRGVNVQSIRYLEAIAGTMERKGIPDDRPRSVSASHGNRPRPQSPVDVTGTFAKKRPRVADPTPLNGLRSAPNPDDPEGGAR